MTTTPHKPTEADATQQQESPSRPPSPREMFPEEFRRVEAAHIALDKAGIPREAHGTRLTLIGRMALLEADATAKETFRREYDGPPPFTSNKAVIEYLESQGFRLDQRAPAGRYRWRLGTHLVTVSDAVYFYTPGPSGEEGFTQRINRADLDAVKVAVSAIKDEQQGNEEIAAVLSAMGHLGFHDWTFEFTARTRHLVFFSETQLRRGTREPFTPLHPDTARMVVSHAELLNALDLCVEQLSPGIVDVVIKPDAEPYSIKMAKIAIDRARGAQA